MEQTDAHIEVRDLTVGYGDVVIQRDVNFTINAGDIFIIMGVSGCGKSTLMRSMIGLLRPIKGQVLFNGTSYWDAEPDEQERIMKKFGVLYQGGALWSSLTLGENIALPLQEFSGLAPREINEIVALKLALVGLTGFQDFYPSELSGGMRKRAGLARAMALDPGILFFDEPSSGLDPISARLLDELILELRDSLGTTVVIVTHELASILSIGNNAVFLDTESKRITAMGNPLKLRDEFPDRKVRAFLTRGTVLAETDGK